MATSQDLFAFAAQEAERQGVPVDLVQRMMKQESGGSATALSPKGAYGPMQLMAGTAKDLGVNRDDPFDNIRGGVKYIGQLLTQFEDPRLAVAAYNAGPANVKKYGDVPPFKETQDYVKKVVGMTDKANDEWTPVTGIEGPAPAVDDWTPVTGINVQPIAQKSAPVARTGPMTLDTIRQELADPNAKKFQQQFQESFNPLDVLRGKTMTGQTLTSAAKGLDLLTLQGLSLLGNKPAQDLLNEQAAQRAQVPKEPTRSISDTISQTFGAITNDPGRALGQIGTQLLDPMALLMPGGVEKSLTAAIPKSVVAAAPKLTKAGTVTATAPVMATTEGIVRAGAEGTPLNTQNLGSDAATAAILGGPLSFSSARAVPKTYKPLTPKEVIAQRAIDQGMALPPSQVAPDSNIARILEGVSGQSKTAQLASLKNQEVVNKKARQTLGLPEDAPITPETFKAYRQEQGVAYDAVKSNNYYADKNFIGNINSKIDELNKLKGVDTSGEIATLRGIKELQFDGNSLVEIVKRLREDAGSNLMPTASAANKQLGKAQKFASEQLEDLIERNLERSKGNADLLSQFRKSRENIAKSYTIEKATNLATGDVSGAALGARAKAGKIVPSELRDVANAAAAYPLAFQNVARMPSPQAFTGMDVVTGIGTAAATGQPLAAAAAAARPAGRSMLTSDYFQRMIRPESPPVGPVKPTPAGLRFGLAVPGLLPYLGEQ